MKILFIGDIMGRAGREALEKYLSQLKNKYNPDITIVNGENSAHGKGITEKICTQFFDLGVDIITTGNHVWDQREVLKYITREPRLIRPANYPSPTTPGKGHVLYNTASGKRVAVINMMCRTFMDPLDDPFACMESLLQIYKLGSNCDAIFVDLHGETTSEKMAFGHHFSGRISAVIGTHTHMPTADYHVMNGTTAYMSDAGMTGDYDSVIGVRKERAIHRFTHKTPSDHFIPASENMTLCGAIVQINPENGHATLIKAIRIGDTLEESLPEVS